MDPSSYRARTITEAILVPVAPTEIAASLRGTYLSQTKVITIGRQEGVDLRLEHSSVSRRHAEISYANGQYVLRDLASSNGTFLNDQPVEPGSLHQLSANDTLRFGQVLCVFRLRQVDPASSVLLRAHKASDSSCARGVPCTFTYLGEPRPILPEAEIAIFRIVQEALANIWRHSQATQANVQLKYLPHLLQLTIRDNGKGFSPEQQYDLIHHSHRSFGLIGMRERARLIGATFTITSSSGQGCTIELMYFVRKANSDTFGY